MTRAAGDPDPDYTETQRATEVAHSPAAVDLHLFPSPRVQLQVHCLPTHSRSQQGDALIIYNH